MTDATPDVSGKLGQPGLSCEVLPNETWQVYSQINFGGEPVSLKTGTYNNTDEMGISSGGIKSARRLNN